MKPLILLVIMLLIVGEALGAGNRFIVEGIVCPICRKSDAIYYGENIYYALGEQHKEYAIICERCDIKFGFLKNAIITKKIYGGCVKVDKDAYKNYINNQISN